MHQYAGLCPSSRVLPRIRRCSSCGMMRRRIHERYLARAAYFRRVMAFTEDDRCYRPNVPKSPILPLAAAVTAVTAVALGASPALGAPLSQGKRDEVRAVAFPLLAVKGQEPASVGSHVSHSSHVSGSGGGHVSHVSHSSHVSSVPGPPPPTAPVAPPPAPAAPPPAATTPTPTPTPTPTASVTTSGPPAVAPAQGSQPGSTTVVASVSPTASSGHGCMFVLAAPFGAVASSIRRFARRRSLR
jgi:hypothetical protein